eukprot:2556332-Rhodomonas_salina.1
MCGAPPVLIVTTINRSVPTDLLASPSPLSSSVPSFGIIDVFRSIAPQKASEQDVDQSLPTSCESDAMVTGKSCSQRGRVADSHRARETGGGGRSEGLVWRIQNTVSQSEHGITHKKHTYSKLRACFDNWPARNTDVQSQCRVAEEGLG